MAFIDDRTPPGQQKGNPESLEPVVAHVHHIGIHGTHRFPDAPYPGRQPCQGATRHRNVMNTDSRVKIVKGLRTPFIQSHDMDFVPVFFRKQARPDGQNPFQPSRPGDAVGNV